MFLGYVINIPLISLIGALFLFGLGLTMLGVAVEINTGDLTNITYNGTTATSLMTTYNYEPYDFGTLGQSSYAWIVMILGAVLFIMFIFRLGD